MKNLSLTKIFQPQALKPTDKRRHSRIKCRLNVSIRRINDKLSFDAICVDVSLGGMGIELIDTSDTPTKICLNDLVEIWIHFSGDSTPIYRKGRIVWFKKIDSLYYRGGIRFEFL